MLNYITLHLKAVDFIPLHLSHGIWQTKRGINVFSIPKFSTMTSKVQLTQHSYTTVTNII